MTDPSPGSAPGTDAPARCAELGARLGDLATLLIDEERVLEASAERKALLANLADFRAPVGVAMGHLRGYLVTGDGQLRSQCEQGLAKAAGALAAITARRPLLTATQAKVVETVGSQFAELTALVPAVVGSVKPARPGIAADKDTALAGSMRIAGALNAALTAMLEEERGLPATPQRKELLAQIADMRGPAGIASAHLRDYAATGSPASRRQFSLFQSRAGTALAGLERLEAVLTATQRAALAEVRRAWQAFGPAAAKTMLAWEQAALAPLRRRTAHRLAAPLGLAAAGAGSLLGLGLAAAAGAGLPTLLALAVAPAGTALAAWSLWRGLLRPMEEAAALLDALIRGEAPAPLRAAAGPAGRLAWSVERARQAVQDLSGTLSGTLAEHRQQRVQRRQSMLSLSDQFGRNVHESITQVQTDVGRMFEQVHAIRAVATSVGGEAGSVDAAGGSAAANLAAIVAAIHELSATASGIGEQTDRSSAMAAEAADSAERAQDAVRRLTEAADQIGAVVTMIEQVAGATQVLALNATIEAARAGDAGRGFAVVAGEVKTLAGRTKQMTGDIRRLVGAVRDNSTHTAAAIAGIGDVVAQMQAIGGAVQAAAGQQSDATGEIAVAAQGASDQVSGIAAAIRTLRGGVDKAQQAAEQLEAVAEGLAARATRLSGESDLFVAEVRAA